MDPNEARHWTEHPSVFGAFLLGAAWAFRELWSLFRKDQSSDRPRPVTPSDLREEVRALAQRFDLLILKLDQQREADVRATMRLEQELRDALMRHRAQDD